MNISDYSQLPEHMRESLDEYMLNGRPVGHFLTAIFSNDLFGAVGRADSTNMPLIPVYVSYVYNKFPIDSYGSKQAIKNWIIKKFEEKTQ